MSDNQFIPPRDSMGNGANVIMGPIDTKGELDILINCLRRLGLLKRDLKPVEIQNFLDVLKNTRQLSGPVDTEFELKIFLDYCKKNNIIFGAVDTPEERKIISDQIMDIMLEDGALSASLAGIRAKQQMKDAIRRPIRKRRRAMDDDMDDNDVNPSEDIEGENIKRENIDPTAGPNPESNPYRNPNKPRPNF